jgi:hypothetical protein
MQLFIGGSGENGGAVDANGGGERRGSRLYRLKQKPDRPPAPTNAAAAAAAAAPPPAAVSPWLTNS